MNSRAEKEAEVVMPNTAPTSTVGGAHAFILMISSYFGLAPLKFESKDYGYAVKISNAMCVYSYIIITTLVICTIAGLAAEMNVGMELSVRMSSRMSQVVSTCDVLVVALTAGAGVYGAPRRMRKMLKLLDSVAMVDDSLGAKYSAVSERKLCALLLTILICFTALLVDDFAFYVIQGKKNNRQWDIICNYIAFYLLYYVMVILELQFAFTAFSINARFKAVNNALVCTAQQLSIPVKSDKHFTLNMYARRVVPVSNGERANINLVVDCLTESHDATSIIIWRKGNQCLSLPPSEAIRRLASLHGSLCDVVRQVDISYSLPVVVILLSTLLHLIVTPYFLILELIISSNRIHFLALQFLWCLTHILRLFVIVEPCHYTINQGRKTEDLICRLMTFAPTYGILTSRLELFSRQIKMRSVCYMPMGMCTLDRPLIASVVGAVTTYLVILIQFQRYGEN